MRKLKSRKSVWFFFCSQVRLFSAKLEICAFFCSLWDTNSENSWDAGLSLFCVCFQNHAENKNHTNFVPFHHKTKMNCEKINFDFFFYFFIFLLRLKEGHCWFFFFFSFLFVCCFHRRSKNTVENKQHYNKHDTLGQFDLARGGVTCFCLIWQKSPFSDAPFQFSRGEQNPIGPNTWRKTIRQQQTLFEKSVHHNN